MTKPAKPAGPRLVLLRHQTYLQMIRSAPGTEIFRTLYARVNGRRRDILDGGDLACAFFVTGLLAALNLVKSMHATVAGAVRDLESSGWKRIGRPRQGAVLVWEAAEQVPGQRHEHIGFYVGRGQAVSNDSKSGRPRQHPWTFGRRQGRPKRKVTAIYWHQSFDS